MKLSKNDKEFELHPEHAGPAVCVDVTTPKKVDTAYGPKEKFSIVFETEALREDGTRFPVWASGFTPSLHEKASLRKFLKSWFGRDLTAAELEEFETESLIGRTAHVTIVHNESDGRTFANIALIRPDKSAQPLKPSGKFIRQKDRKKDGDSNYARVPANGAGDTQSADTADWKHAKVHVGRHAGLELMDLDRAAVKALITHWLPEAKALPKPKADDKRLIMALEQAAAQMGLATPEDDDIPY